MECRFIKKLNIIVLIALFCSIALTTPVIASDAPKVLNIGDKVKIGDNSEATYLGKSPDGRKGLWKATIDAPKYLSGTNTSIATAWVSRDGNFYTKNNLYNAAVFGDKVIVNFNEQSMEWTPVLSVNAKKLNASKPNILAVDPINTNYSWNTIRWDYGSGIYRQLRQVEGVLIETFIISAKPAGDISIRENKVKSSKFNYDRPIWAMDANKQLIKITDTGGVKFIALSDLANAKYPITIDPSSTYTTSSADGRISWSVPFATGYNALWVATTGTVTDTDTLLVIGQHYNVGTAAYEMYRSSVYFDTSDIPDDATISSATLKLYGDTDGTATNDFLITAQTGTNSTYPHNPLLTGDYDKSNYSGNGSATTTVGLSVAGYNSITLSATGLTWINKTGITKLEIRSDRDIAGVTPTGDEYIFVYAYEQGAGFRPQLEIVYAAALPTVTTGVANTILATSANLTGTITSTGGADVDIVGFDYGTTSGVYTGNISTGGNFTGDFYHVEGLSAGTTYYYRAKVRNSTGYAYGAELNFNTIGSPVIDTIAATSVTQTTATLNASLSDDGGNTANVTVRWGYGIASKTTAQFATYTNVTAYQSTKYSTGEFPSLAVTSLTPGTPYYFRVEALNIAGTLVSATEGTFTTASGLNPPSLFVAQPTSNSTIDLTWIIGTGSTNTIVRYQIGSIPTSNSTGTLLVNTTGSDYIHSGLSTGTTYGYRAWGLSSNGSFSSTSVTALVTTLGTSTTGSTMPSLTEPSGWWATPDATLIRTNFPFAPFIDNFANSIGMPLNNFWLFLALGIALGFGVLVYSLSHHLMAGSVSMILGMWVGWWQGLIPLFIPVIVLLIAISIITTQQRT
jgi:hypothetical protein